MSDLSALIGKWREIADKAAPTLGEAICDTKSGWTATNGSFEFWYASRTLLPALLDVAETMLWYADSRNYVPYFEYDDQWKPIRSHNPISESGERARKALARLAEVGKP